VTNGNPLREELEAVRSDLDLVRNCVMHPGDLDGAEIMQNALASAAERLRGLTGSPDRLRTNAAGAVDDILLMRREFRDLELLFQNARSLQEGWFRLAVPPEQPLGYGPNGSLEAAGASGKGPAPGSGHLG
jgi:hypothetical protein